MSGTFRSQVLREVSVHPLARTLERLPRAGPPPPVQPEPVVLPAVDEIREQAHRAGHEQGLAQGLAEGREAGYPAGYEAGLEAGRLAVEEAVQASRHAEMQRLEDVVQSAAAQVARRVAEAEDDMLELVFAAICRLAGELAVSRSGVREMLRHAISQVAERPLLSVRMHEQDLAALRGDPEISATLDPPGGMDSGTADAVQWVADERVQMGGCLLETAAGTLDLTLETQLRRLRETLLQARGARRTQEPDAC